MIDRKVNVMLQLWGEIQDEEFVELGRKYGIPTFNDCAADVPPVDNLLNYTKMGFDLVTISGGKGWLGEGVFVCMSMARSGEERVVARRLREIPEKFS